MKKYNFIDLFSGCGGFSLGAVNAGLNGVFCVEKDPDAFSTYQHNLIAKHGYAWPEWLPVENLASTDILENYKTSLKKLSNKVDVIIGGPPCQGFSLAGKRMKDDTRNHLVEDYLEIVSIIKPKLLIIENVKGFDAAFNKGEKSKADYTIEMLEENGYKAEKKLINCSMFGVPQSRERMFIVAYKKKVKGSIFDGLDSFVNEFLEEKGLTSKLTVEDAISDLEISKNTLAEYDINSRFNKIVNKKKKLTSYQKLINNNVKDIKNTRLANHRPETLAKFEYFLNNSKKGVNISNDLKDKFNLRKRTLSILDNNKASRTITTLPDDLIHYNEPRILTSRECARIQSFPDSFEFKGKYTTGGPRRKMECPIYTQIGNAVPPLAAEGLIRFITEKI